MKTLIAALALTLAASAPALAFDPYDAQSGGIAQINQVEKGSVNTFGFRGLQAPSTHVIDMDALDARSAGSPLVGRDGMEVSTFGFRGVVAPSTFEIDHNAYDAKSNGGPLVR